jgi:pilus assembly protein CpaB
MNKSVLMIMGGAVIVAIIVAMLVQSNLASKSAKNNASAEGVEVLVANKMLMTGDVLKSSDAHWEPWSSNAVFNGMIRRKDQADENKLEVYDKPLRRDIMSGEPITTQAVVLDAKGGFLSALLSPGMRAVGVPVKAETAVGGFVSVGDYVDVILTYQISLRGNAGDYAFDAIQNFASETILSNVRVLAVDQSAKEGDRDAKVARTVTIEVSKEGAQVLAMATTMGTISLSLRHLGEKDTQADNDVPLTTDVTTSRVIKKIYEIMNKSKTTSNAVRLYSGSTVVNVPVRAAK